MIRRKRNMRLKSIVLFTENYSQTFIFDVDEKLLCSRDEKKSKISKFKSVMENQNQNLKIEMPILDLYLKQMDIEEKKNNS